MNIGEKEVKIVLVSKELINEEEDMYRVSCDDMRSGWGVTLEKAIRNFDTMNYRK